MKQGLALLFLATAANAHFLISTPLSRGAKIETSKQKTPPCGGQSPTPLEQRSVFPLTNGHVLFWHEYDLAPVYVYAFPTDETASITNSTGKPGVWSSGTLIAPAKQYPYGDNRFTIRDIVAQAKENGATNTSWMVPGAAITLQLVLPMQTPTNRTYSLCSDVILADSSNIAKCIDDSTSPDCRLTYYPDDQAEEEFEDLCVKAPYLSSCNFHDVCEEGTTIEEEGSELGRYCGYQFLLKAACTVDIPSLPSSITTNVSECAAVNKLCKAGSVVQQCKNNPPIPAGYISTGDLMKQSQAFCAASPTTKECGACKIGASNDLSGYIAPTSPTFKDACQHMLSTYSDLCLHASSNAACAAHKAMCVARPDDNISPDLSKTEFCVDTHGHGTPTSGVVKPTVSPKPSAGGRLSVKVVLVALTTLIFI